MANDTDWTPPGFAEAPEAAWTPPGFDEAPEWTPPGFESAPDYQSPFASTQAPAAPQEPEKEFFRFDDTISGIWDAVKGLGVTAPAAFYQLTEGLERPDKYSDAAKQAFAEADAYAQEMEKKTAENQAKGISSSVGESFREAGQSLGFTLGSLGAAIPAAMVGGKVGGSAGALIGAGVGAPAGGVGAAPGAALGGTIGYVVGAGTAAAAASGTAAYRMAGAAFLNEAFQEIERHKGAPLTEQEKVSAYEALLPIAKNTALWEAGPEAIGSAVTAGAGKIVFGLGKSLTEKFAAAGLTKASAAAATPLGKASLAASKFAETKLGKAAVAASTIPVELGTETLTQVEQSADQKKMQLVAEGKDPDMVKADWSAAGVSQAFQDVMPQTLALLGLMGGAGGAIKVTAKAVDMGYTKLQEKGLVQTAAALEQVNAPATPAQAVNMGAIAAEPAEEGKVGGFELPTSKRGEKAVIATEDDTGAGVMKALFGGPEKGFEWSPAVRPDDVTLAPNPVNKDEDIVMVKPDGVTSRPTAVVYNRKTKTFGPADAATLKAIDGGTTSVLVKPSSLQQPVQKTETDLAQSQQGTPAPTPQEAASQEPAQLSPPVSPEAKISPEAKSAVQTGSGGAVASQESLSSESLGAGAATAGDVSGDSPPVIESPNAPAPELSAAQAVSAATAASPKTPPSNENQSQGQGQRQRQVLSPAPDVDLKPVEAALQAQRELGNPAIPDQPVAELVRDALNGDTKARTALEQVVGAEGVKEALQAALGSVDTSSMEESERVAASRKQAAFSKGLRLQAQPQTATTAKVAPESGRRHFVKAAWDEVVKKRGERLTVDNQNVQVGNVITSGNDSGTQVQDVYVVTGQTVLKNGTTRHYLSKVQLKDGGITFGQLASEASRYRSDPRLIKEASAIMRKWRATSKLPLALRKAALTRAMETLIRRHFTRLVGEEMVTDALVFTDQVDAMDAGFDTNAKGEQVPSIRVNPLYYAEKLLERMNAMDGSSGVTGHFVVEDMASEISHTALEELTHIFGYHAIPDVQDGANAINDLLDVADSNQTAMLKLVAAARWRFAEMAGKSNEEVVEAVRQMDDLQKYAVMQELLAALYARVKTGSTVADVRMQAERWVKALAGKNPSQTLVARLIELANRYFEGIRNFLLGQKELTLLPASTQRLLSNLDQLMKDGGVRLTADMQAPGTNAASQLSGELAKLGRVAKNQASYAKAQTALRGLLKKIRERRGPDVVPVTLTRDGMLETDPLYEADYGEELQPILDELNSNSRPDQTVYFMGVARDLEMVLRRLNEGSAPIAARENRIGNLDLVSNVGMIVDRVADDVARSSGLTHEDARNRINAAAGELASQPILMEGYEEAGKQLMDVLLGLPEEAGFVKAASKARASLKELLGDNATSFMADLDVVEQTREQLEIAREQKDATAIARLEARLADHHSTYPAGVDAEAVDKARAELARASQLVRERIEALTTQTDKDGKPTLLAQRAMDLQTQRRNALENAARAFERRERMMRPVASLQELVARFAANPGEAALMVSRAFPSRSQDVLNALQSASTSLEAARRLATFRDELEWMLIGGRPPISLQAARNRTAWSAITTQSDLSTINFAPLNTPRILLGATTGVIGDSTDTLFAKGEGPAQSVSAPAEHGTLTFRWSPDWHPVEDNGDIRFERETYQMMLNGLSIELKEGSIAASRMFGVEPHSFPSDENGEPLNSMDLQDLMVANIRPFVHNAVVSLQAARWRNHKSVSNEVTQTNGFPLPYRDNDGNRALMTPQQIVPMPDLGALMDFTREGDAQMLDGLQNGAFAEMLVGIAGFVRDMSLDNPEGVARPLLSHENGLTPAGLAWQALAPKFTEFLALTKGLKLALAIDGQIQEVDVQRMLMKSFGALVKAGKLTKEEAESHRNLLEAAYSRLAEGLETQFFRERSELSAKLNAKKDKVLASNLASYVWDLHRNAKMANRIYGESMRFAARQREENPVSAETGYPLDPDAIDDARFQIGHRMHFTDTYDGDTLISLLAPVRARRFLDDYARIFNTPATELLRMSGADTQAAAAANMTLQDYYKSGRGELILTPFADLSAEGAVAFQDLQGWQVDNLEKAEKRIEKTKARWRTLALLAMMGGDVDRVLDFTHSPDFLRVVNGEPVFNTEAIDSFILDEMERFAAEERQRGVISVIGEDNPAQGRVVDEAVRQLADRQEAWKPALEAILNNGGTVEVALQESNRLETGTFYGFEADARTLTHTLASMIPGLTILRSNLRYELNQDRGQMVEQAQMELPLKGIPGYTPGEKLVGDAPRIPALGFIPDQVAPTLVMPYGGNVAATPAELRDTMVAMLEWLGTNGPVNLVAASRRIVDQLAVGRGENPERMEAFQKARVALLQNGQINWDEHGDAYIAAGVSTDEQVMRRAVDKALDKVEDEVSGWLTGEFNPDGLNVRSAARIIALALTNNHVKRALVMSMGAAPDLAPPTTSQMALRGDIIGPSVLPGMYEMEMTDRMVRLLEGGAPTNGGVGLDVDDDGYATEIQRQHLAALKAEFGEDAEEKMAEEGMSPIGSSQAEWASTLLHGTLTDLEYQAFSWAQILRRQEQQAREDATKDPFTSAEAPERLTLRPTGLATLASTKDVQLSEFEARQLLAVIDPQTIQGIIDENSSRELAWNMAKLPDNTVDDLMRLTAEAAERLRAEFKRVRTFKPGDERSENHLFNYKTFSFTDPLDWQASYGSMWHQTRVRKGMVAAAEKLIAADPSIGFLIQTEQGFRRAVMGSDFEKLRKAAIAANILHFVDDPRGGPKIDELTLARREYEEEQKAHDAWVQNIQNDIARQDGVTRALETALTDLGQLEGELLGAADYAAYKRALSRVRGIDVGNGSLYDADPMVKAIFEDRDSLVSRMSEEMVDEWLEGVTSIQRSLNLRSVAGLQSPSRLLARRVRLRERKSLDPIDNPLALPLEQLEEKRKGEEAQAKERFRIAREEVLARRNADTRQYHAMLKAVEDYLALPDAERAARKAPYAPTPEQFNELMEGYNERLKELAAEEANRTFLERRKAMVAARQASAPAIVRTQTSFQRQFGDLASVHLEHLAPVMARLALLPGQIAEMEAKLDEMQANEFDGQQDALANLEERLESARWNLNYNRAKYALNVQQLTKHANAIVPGMVEMEGYELGENPEMNQETMARYRQLLRDMRSGDTLLDLLRVAVARTALRNAERFGLEDVSSLNLNQGSRYESLRIPDAAVPELLAVMQRGGDAAAMKARVEAVLGKHVFPMEGPARAATSALRARISGRLNERATINAGLVMSIFKEAADVPELQLVDETSASRIIASVARELLEADVASSEAEVRRRLVTLAKQEARYANRQTKFWASRDHRGKESVSALQINGGREESLVASRWLAKIGTRWSQLYMGLDKNKSMLDGYADALERARTADELMELGMEAMEVATGRSYGVVNDVVVPLVAGDSIAATQLLQSQREIEDAKAIELGYESWAHMRQVEDAEAQVIRKYTRQTNFNPSSPLGSTLPLGGELSSLRLGTLPQGVSRATSLARANDLVGKLEKNGFLGARNKITKDLAATEAARLGDDAELDPINLIRQDVRERLAILAAVYESGAMRDKGYLPEAPEGSPAQRHSFHSQIDMLFKQLDGAPTAEAIRDIHALSNQVVGYMLADKGLADLVAGFIPKELFKKSLIRSLLNHDPLVRRVFAKSAAARKTVMDTIGLLDHGATGGMGRNGFTAQNNAYAKMLSREEKQLKGEDKYVDAAMGYMFQAMKGYLLAGSQSDRAEALLRMFDQADDGLATALVRNMPQNMGGYTPAQVLKMPLHMMKRFVGYMSEPTYRMLEQQKVYEHLRERFKPILQQMADGTSSPAEAIQLMEATLSPQARKWGETVSSILGNLKNAYIQQARMAGYDVGRMESSGAVGFHWRVFHREYNLSDPMPSLQEQLSFDRAAWLVGPNRNLKRGEIHMLNINGFEAVKHQISDMLYRINMQPAYGVFQAAVGTTVYANNALEPANFGWMDRLAPVKVRENEVNDAIGAARTIALLGQEIISKDRIHEAPDNLGMNVVQKFQQVGATKALISASQIYRQTIPGTFFYTLVYGGRENWSYPKWLLRYTYDRIAGRIGSKFGQGQTSSFSRHVDWCVERYAPNTYKRTADGQANYFEDINRIKPSKAMRSEGRVSGKLRPVVDAAMYVPRELSYWTMKTADWMLHHVLAKPESFAVRSVWAFEVTKALNKKLVAEGRAPVTVEQAMDPANGYHAEFDQGILSHAERATTDLMAGTDKAKKGELFQERSTAMGEVGRGMLATFANHQMHMAGNTYAAWSMIRHGDAESRKEGYRLIGTSLGQNIMFQLLRFEVVTLTLTALLGLLFSWDDDEEKEFYGSLYGIDPDSTEDERRGKLMHWVALLGGGSPNPIGWNNKGKGWDEKEHEKDVKDFTLRASKEVVAQIPGVGLFAATALGNSLSEWALKNTVMELVPGELGYYERAGFILPERWGGTGDGPQSDSGIERLAYRTSKLFLNDIASRSTLTGGITSVVDPLVQISNAPQEVGMLDASMLWMSSFPAMPRELRREFQRPFLDNTEAKIWSGSWERRK